MRGQSTDHALLTENQIDTALFSIFEIYAGISSSQWHVCLCNPPGGDWSRISLLSETGKSLYIWNTLPRVRDENKLPDFVVQAIVPEARNSFVLSIESKDRPRNLELDIGHRMNQFVEWLTSEIQPSLSKDVAGEKNMHEELADFVLVNAVATSFHPQDSTETILGIWEKCKCDFCMNFVGVGNSVRLEIFVNPRYVDQEYINLLKQILEGVRDYADLELIFNES